MITLRSVLVCSTVLVGFSCAPKSGSVKSDGAGAGGRASTSDASLPGNGGNSGHSGGVDGGTPLLVVDATAPTTDAKLLADSGCEAVSDTRPQAPNVLIVLDRSRSMYLPPVDRWNPAVTAIEQLTAQLDGQIQFGLLEFPSPSAPTIQQLCAPGDLIVPPALHTATRIAAALVGDPTTKVGGATPTAAALGAAHTALSSLSGSSYVLLITDGAPNCDASLDSQTCTCTSAVVNDCTGAPTSDGGLPGRKTPELCLDDTATVAAVSALTTGGVKTFVVGYDASGFEPTLNAMAAAGGSSRTTFFQVNDAASLAQAFQSISAYVVSCTYELSVAPKDDRYVSVAVDGKRLSHGDYSVTNGTRVDIVGSACAAISDGKPHDVLVVRECQPVIR